MYSLNRLSRIVDLFGSSFHLYMNYNFKHVALWLLMRQSKVVAKGLMPKETRINLQRNSYLCSSFSVLMLNNYTLVTIDPYPTLIHWLETFSERNHFCHYLRLQLWYSFTDVLQFKKHLLVCDLLTYDYITIRTHPKD